MRQKLHNHCHVIILGSADVEYTVSLRLAGSELALTTRAGT
jgi:hypothetical protein